MSEEITTSTKLTFSEPLKKNLIIVGLVGCGVEAIWRLILTFISIWPNGLIVANRVIINLFALLVIAGLTVLVNLLDKKDQVKIILYIGLAIVAIITIVAMFTNIYSQIWARFVLRIILAAPIIALYALFWKEALLAQILLVVRSLSLVLRLLQTGLGLAPSINTYGLYITNSLLMVAYFIILGVWFFQIMQNDPINITKQDLDATMIQGKQASSDSIAGSYVYPKPHGLNRTLPALLFWCDTCNKQAKKVKLQSMKKEDVEKEHICPDCNSVVRAFWLEPNQNRYIKFVIGLSLFAGSVIVFAITNAFGWLGWAPYLFAVLCLIGAFILNWDMLTRSFGIEGPPPHATTIPSAEPGQDFLKEAIIVGVLALIGGLIVFGIIVGISSLF